MKRCRYWRKRIPEAIYGELDAKTRETMESHLAACGGCVRLYEGMAGAVRKMEARPAPDREPEFWEGYWDRLESRMALEAAASDDAAAETEAAAAGRSRRPRRAFRLPAWAFGAAGAIVLIAIGIFIGRTFFRPSAELPALVRTAPSETDPGGRLTPAAVEAAPLAVRTSRYLKRSRMLLLAVVNADPQDGDPFRLNLPLQKRTSEELLREAVVLKAGFRGSDRRLERLVSDLELILLQIANLSTDSDASDIEVIKAGVEDRDIFFKINLSEIRRPSDKSGRGPSSGPWGDGRSPSRAKTAAEA
ncbi:MAG: zf-HC2 domain-containing protein [Candidatus Aminicenantes bacterium RBG_16_66_30]